MFRKVPAADLRLTYPLILEGGIILALLIMIAATNVRFPEQNQERIAFVRSEETALILPPSVSETKPALKPPPIPTVPVKIPNDEPIELFPVEMDEFNIIDRLMVPPLPQQIFTDVNYELFKDIEQLPVMIGGEDAFRKSIDYPKHARRFGIQGIVEVEFEVNTNGRVLNPIILRGIGGGCDDAVLKAIKIQRYIPGKKAGKVASFRIKETVQFILLDT
ncbi:TonB family protein [Gracilimonas sp.]|uniref:energy transducer TonB n=1 Tax=Gracilimonas sp. TaxID=1974203 RepID=UPI0032EF9246